MIDIAPITLHTDASDYGVGGYLFQTVDGIDQPVAFVSKSLNKSQLRWSVIQKEAYGTFYSCMYLQSLLRDHLFTIRTDHRNLLFITEASVCNVIGAVSLMKCIVVHLLIASFIS